MFKPTAVFSGFSVDDIEKAKKFYGETLGLDAQANQMGMEMILPGGASVFVYEKADHEPASFTILNLVVDDIDAAVEELEGRGVKFERYDSMTQDDKGIARGKQAKRGPDIAWFKDPAANVLSVLGD